MYNKKDVRGGGKRMQEVEGQRERSFFLTFMTVVDTIINSRPWGRWRCF